jgi:hypothetical protein
VEAALQLTRNLTDISPETLAEHPGILPTLRMATAPPLARDRLIGLAGVSNNLVRSMELYERVPPRMSSSALLDELRGIGKLIRHLADKDILPWLESDERPSPQDIHRAATVVADRLCGAVADPIVRNAQEKRQLAYISEWLQQRGYRLVTSASVPDLPGMQPGTYALRLNVSATLGGGSRRVKIPIDVAIMPRKRRRDGLPVAVECKSAGDFTNTNKRRKEEAAKIAQLKASYGNDTCFILFLCGYFDSGYLGYEAAEGLDWVWEHRIDDLTQFGV